MKSLVIIPTYNEKENIESLLWAILKEKLPLDLLVVDDNSPDGTSQIVQKIPQKKRRVFQIIRKRRLGLGSALASGFRWALQRKYNYILTMDADFSHHPRFLKNFLNANKNLDLVIGSRYIKGGKISGWEQYREDLSKVANLAARLLLGLKPRDVTSGFRRYSQRFFKNFNFKNIVSSGYAFQVEMVFLTKRLRLQTLEIPITFYERREGQSKIKGEVWRSIQILGRLFIRRRGVRQLIKFGIVGISNLIIDFGILNLAVLVLKLNVYLAGAIALILALSNSFYWNRSFTFRSRSRGVLKEYLKFAIINGLGALFNFLIFAALIYYLSLWYNLAKALSILVTWIWNFLGSKYWVFRK